MADGIRSSNLPLASVIDEFLGHEIVGGAASLKRVSRASVFGPIEASIASVSAAAGSVTAALDSRISDLELGQATGGAVFATRADLDASLNYAANVKAEVFADSTEANNGVYKKLGASGVGSWVKISDLAIKVVATEVATEVAALAPSIAVQNSERADDRIAFTTPAVGFDVPEGTSLIYPASFTARFWAKAIDLAHPVYATAALLPVLIDVTTPIFSMMDVRVWKRLKAAASNSGPGIAGDLLVFSKQLSVTGVDPTNPLMQMARVELGGINMTPDYTWIVAWVALDAALAVMRLGAAQGLPADAVGTGYNPGWVGFAGYNGAYTLLSSTAPLAFTLLEGIPAKRPATGGANTETAYAGSDPGAMQSPFAYGRNAYPGSLITTGPFQVRQDHKVTIPSVDLIRGSGSLNVITQDVTLTDLTVDTVAAEAVTLTYNPPGTAANITNLSHRYVTNVVVTRVSDGAVLVEGTDYRLGWEAGQLLGLVNTAPFAVHVAFKGSYHRYDLIYVDPDTLAVGKVDGTARLIDPEEYRPACPAGKVPLFMVYFYRYGVLDVIELIPIHQWKDYVRVGREAEHDRWLEYCRSCLPKTFKKLYRGETVKFVSYGDSNYNMGASNTQYTRQTGNDQLGFFTSQRTPSDTAALYAGLNFTEDGVSKTPINFPFFYKEAIESRFGSKVLLENFSISGTGAQGSTYDGDDPLRLAGVIAAKPDLVLIGFGSNGATYSGMTTIISTLQAAGIECIVHGIPRVNFYSGTITPGVPTTAAWSKLNEMLVRVARANHCAYVNTEALFALGNEGACGLSQRTMGGASTYNHIGIAERRAAGEYGSLIFGGKVGAVPSGPSLGHVSVQVPATGFTITMAAVTKILVLKPAGTLAAGTVNLPSTTVDETVVRICSSQTITAFTLGVSVGGQSIFNAPTTLPGGSGISFVYDAATTTWYRLQ